MGDFRRAFAQGAHTESQHRIVRVGLQVAQLQVFECMEGAGARAQGVVGAPVDFVAFGPLDELRGDFFGRGFLECGSVDEAQVVARVVVVGRYRNLEFHLFHVGEFDFKLAGVDNLERRGGERVGLHAGGGFAFGAHTESIEGVFGLGFEYVDAARVGDARKDVGERAVRVDIGLVVGQLVLDEVLQFGGNQFFGRFVVGLEVGARHEVPREIGSFVRRLVLDAERHARGGQVGGRDAEMFFVGAECRLRHGKRCAVGTCFGERHVGRAFGSFVGVGREGHDAFLRTVEVV